HRPNLRFGNPSSQLVACLQFILSHLVHAAVDINGDKLAVILGFEPGMDVVFVNGIAALSELFFAVAAFDGAHHHPSLWLRFRAGGTSAEVFVRPEIASPSSLN